MKIKDISVADVRQGKNWRLLSPLDDSLLDLAMEEWGPIEEVADFLPDDQIVYSGLSVCSGGIVTPIVCLREVQYPDYGGDYCEFIDGRWRQMGLVPNPNASPSREFFANPLDIDPSFDSDDNDYRRFHRDGFAKHMGELANDA